MGCAFLHEQQATHLYHHQRVLHRTMRIDCRKKSYRIPTQITEDIQVLPESIAFDSEEAKFVRKVFQQHPLFYSLTNEQIEQTIKIMKIGTNKKDQYVFRSGDVGSSFFIILSGSVSVSTKDGEKEKVQKILNPGQCFGELALLYSAPRAASIKILTNDFKVLILMGQPFKKIVTELRQKHFSQIKGIIEKIKIFELLSKKQKITLANALIKEQYPKDTVLFKEGQSANVFYIIQSGKVEIQFEEKNKKDLMLGPLQSFGENSFNNNGRRQGTAVVKSNLVCLSINNASMKRCFGESLSNIIFHNMKKWALKMSPLFHEFDTRYLDYLALQFENKYARAHDIICNDQGSIDSIYICLQGTMNKQKPGTVFYDNCFFDEYCKSHQLIEGTVHTNFSKKKQEDEMLMKDNDGMYAKLEFKKLKDCIAVMRQKVAKNNLPERRSSLLKGRNSALSIGNIMPSQDRIDERSTLTLDSLQYIKKLGSGQFGMVYLVRQKNSGCLFALKSLDKFSIKDEQMIDSVIAERQILSSICNPLIVGYYNAYEDAKNIYFLLEFINGIEMFEAIREIGLLNKAISRYYLGSLVLAIEYLHSLNIIYRDLKPENSLVNHEGKVFLIDLGTAKTLRYEENYRTHTIIGTPHYMAPQAMQGSGYSFQVDFWSLGVILYEFVCGKLPFAENLEKPLQIYLKIKNNQLSFPSFVKEKDVMDLIKRLLCKDPKNRMAGGFQFIKYSKYFEGFLWEDLENGKMKPPYVPHKFRRQTQKFQSLQGCPLTEFLKPKTVQTYVSTEWNTFVIE